MTNDIREKAIEAAIDAAHAEALNTAKPSQVIRAAISAYEKALWRPITSETELSEDKEVLLTDGEAVMTGLICHSDADDLFFPVSEHGLIAATHWMPLPAPPEVG